MRTTSALLFVSLLAASCAPERKEESPAIGLELYSFRDQFPKDVPGWLEKVKALGITEVEIHSRYGMSPEDFKQLVDSKGLKIISTNAEFIDLESNPQAAADTAKLLGASYVVTFWIPHQEDSFNVGDAERAIKVFNQAGRVLRENGLKFCYHLHGFEFVPDSVGTLFDRLLLRTDSAYVNFEMDVFWVRQPGQDPVELLKKYPGRFKLMHLKDRLPGTPDSQDGHADVESNVVLGEGDVGIREIMEVAPGAGVKHYFIEDESSRSEQQIPKSLEFLRQLQSKTNSPGF